MHLKPFSVGRPSEIIFVINQSVLRDQSIFYLLSTADDNSNLPTEKIEHEFVSDINQWKFVADERNRLRK